MIFLQTLATGEKINLNVKNIYQALAIGDQNNRQRGLTENYELERIWQEGEEPNEDFDLK